MAKQPKMDGAQKLQGQKTNLKTGGGYEENCAHYFFFFVCPINNNLSVAKTIN